MIKLKEQLTLIEANYNNNLKSFMEKKLLEVNNISNNQKFVIDNIYEFHNQLKKFNISKQAETIKDNLIIYVMSYFLSFIVAFAFSYNPLLAIFMITYNIYITIRFMYINFSIKFGHKNNIEIPNNFFDNKYEPISPAQIYHTQNKEISEENFYNSQFWKPMSIKELFTWIEENNTLLIK